MFKKLCFLWLITALIISCTVKLLPPANANLVADITKLQDDVQSFYDGMAAATDKSYNTYQPGYQQIDGEIQAIVSTEQARPHAAGNIKSAKNIQSIFSQYEADHKARGSLPGRTIITYKDYMYGVIKPLLVTELSIK